MIRLLALDIDGTLLASNGQLPDENRDAISRAVDSGVEVALATGRRYDFARPIFEQLPVPLTLIVCSPGSPGVGVCDVARAGPARIPTNRPAVAASATLERSSDPVTPRILRFGTGVSLVVPH